MHIWKALSNILNSKYVQHGQIVLQLTKSKVLNQFLKLTILYLLLKTTHQHVQHKKKLENWGQIQKMIICIELRFSSEFQT